MDVEKNLKIYKKTIDKDILLLYNYAVKFFTEQ